MRFIYWALLFGTQPSPFSILLLKCSKPFGIFVKGFWTFWLMCCLKLNSLSNMPVRYFVYWAMGIMCPFSFNCGSRWHARFYQKWIQTFLVLENRKPFSLVHLSILFRQIWICLSRDDMFRDHLHTGTFQLGLMPFTMLLILNKVTDKTLPWGTPAYFLCRFDVVFLFRTLKIQCARKFLVNVTILSLLPIF